MMVEFSKIMAEIIKKYLFLRLGKLYKLKTGGKNEN